MRAKYSRDYIATQDNVLSGDVSLSERETQVLLMTLSTAVDRYNWDEMSDTQWDTMEQLVNRISFKLLGITYV